MGVMLLLQGIEGNQQAVPSLSLPAAGGEDLRSQGKGQSYIDLAVDLEISDFNHPQAGDVRLQ
jgi:hypothetical protein